MAEGLVLLDHVKGFHQFSISDRLRSVLVWAYNDVGKGVRRMFTALRLFLGVSWAPLWYQTVTALVFGDLSQVPNAEELIRQEIPNIENGDIDVSMRNIEAVLQTFASTDYAGSIESVSDRSAFLLETDSGRLRGDKPSPKSSTESNCPNELVRQRLPSLPPRRLVYEKQDARLAS